MRTMVVLVGVVLLAGCVTADDPSLSSDPATPDPNPVLEPDGRVLTEDSISATGQPDNSRTFAVELDSGRLALEVSREDAVLVGDMRIGIESPSGHQAWFLEATAVISPAGTVTVGNYNSRPALSAEPGEWRVIVQTDGAARFDYQVTWI